MKIVINIKSFLQRLAYELWKILQLDLCGFLLVLKLDQKLYEYKQRLFLYIKDLYLVKNISILK